MPIIQIENLSKTFDGNRVLTEATIALHAGEVHALLGHNGSGKSTLIKTLAGVHRPDPGSRAWFAGEEVSLDDPSGAWRRNLRFIHQDLGLIPSLSAAENLALVRGYETTAGRISWRREKRKAQEAIARFGGRFDVTLAVGTLPKSAQSLIAIARAFEGMAEDAQPVIVLDEPTASLPQREVEILFAAIRQAVAHGAALMLVSHRLNDVTALADRITVLRDGHVIAAGEAGRRTKEQLVDLLVGSAVPPERQAIKSSGGERIAEFTGITGETVSGVSLQVEKGEIVGIAGLDGSGREELASLLQRSGTDLDRRQLRFAAAAPEQSRGGLLTKRPNPVGLVPADRKGQGLIPSFSIRENLTLPSMGPVTRRGRILIGREKADTAKWIQRLNILPPRGDTRTSELSGGNAQKVLIGKALRLNPRILVADEPTAGVDVAAKAQIYRDLDAVADSGVGVVVVSSDTEELAILCDRVLVMGHGRFVGELVGTEITEDAVHRLAHHS